MLRALAAGMKEAEEAILADPQAALDATAEQVPAMADPVQRESAAKVLEATSQLWLRNGKVIKKATKKTYRLTKKDRRKKISVRVTYRLAGATTVVRIAKLAKKVK